MSLDSTFKASAVVLYPTTIPTHAASEECPGQRESFLTAVLQSLGDRGFMLFFVQNSQTQVQTSCVRMLSDGRFSSPPVQALTKQVKCLFIHWIRILGSNFHLAKKVSSKAELQPQQLISFHRASRVFCFALQMKQQRLEKL